MRPLLLFSRAAMNDRCPSSEGIHGTVITNGKDIQ
jgi:hypothetical protein